MQLTVKKLCRRAPSVQLAYQNVDDISRRRSAQGSSDDGKNADGGPKHPLAGDGHATLFESISARKSADEMLQAGLAAANSSASRPRRAPKPGLSTSKLCGAVGQAGLRVKNVGIDVCRRTFDVSIAVRLGGSTSR